MVKEQIQFNPFSWMTVQILIVYSFQQSFLTTIDERVIDERVYDRKQNLLLYKPFASTE